MNSIFQINTSRGGVPKLPMFEAFVTVNGIVGDKQRDLRYHGGPERAISLCSLQLIQKLQAEGHPIQAGSTGENLTISFPKFELLIPDTKLKIGEHVILQITSYAAPCKTIKASFIDENFSRFSNKLFPNESRLYARVLNEGLIKQGDSVSIIK